MALPPTFLCFVARRDSSSMGKLTPKVSPPSFSLYNAGWPGTYRDPPFCLLPRNINPKNTQRSSAWWFMPLILVLKRQRQVAIVCEFKSSFVYIASSRTACRENLFQKK